MTHKLQVHRIHGHLHTFTIDSIDSCLPNCPESRICMTFPRSCSCWIWVQLLRNCNGGAALWRHGLSHEACLKVLIVLAPNITESPTILPNIQASSNVIAKASLQLTPLCLGFPAPLKLMNSKTSMAAGLGLPQPPRCGRKTLFRHEKKSASRKKKYTSRDPR